jgi:hypothetical protein
MLHVFSIFILAGLTYVLQTLDTLTSSCSKLICFRLPRMVKQGTFAYMNATSKASKANIAENIKVQIC